MFLVYVDSEKARRYKSASSLFDEVNTLGLVGKASNTHQRTDCSGLWDSKTGRESSPELIVKDSGT